MTAIAKLNTTLGYYLCGFFAVSFFSIASMAQTFAPLNSVSPAAYIPFTLTNSQGSATPINLQVRIDVNSNANSTRYANDLRNVNWQDGRGNILASWLESGETNTSPTSVYWVNLGSRTIAAGGGTRTIYQVIYATKDRAMDGTITGAHPNYTGTWGQYDSGANVFTHYGGKTWTNFTMFGGAWNTTNGYLQQTSTGGVLATGPGAYVTSSVYSVNDSFVIETAFNYSLQSVARVGLIAIATDAGSELNSYRFIGQQFSSAAGHVSFLNDVKAWVSNGTYQGATSTNYTLSIQNAGGTWSGNLHAGFGLAGTVLASLADTAYTTSNSSSATAGTVGVSAAYFNGSATIGNPANFYWFRLRTFLPGGILPAVSVGAVTNIKTGFLFMPF